MTSSRPSQPENPAAICPGCRVGLVDATGTLVALVCPAGHGTALPPASAQQLLVKDAELSPEVIGRLMGAPGPRQRPCPSCQTSMTHFLVEATDVEICGGCGTAWMERGAISVVSKGRHLEPQPRRKQMEVEVSAAASQQDFGTGAGSDGAPVDAPDEGALPRLPPLAAPKVQGSRGKSGPPVLLVAGVVVFVLAVGGAIGGYLWWDSQEVTVAETEDALSMYKKYERYFVNYTFGGRTLNWWTTEISEAAPKGARADAERFTLLRRRAKNAGLRVVEDDGDVRVVPGDETKRALVTRLKL